MNFLKKLQDQPEDIRKIIVWGITIFLAVVLVGLWIFYSYSRVKKFNKELFMDQLNPPDFNEEAKKQEESINSNNIIK